MFSCYLMLMMFKPCSDQILTNSLTIIGTQIPQYILNNAIEKERGSLCNIIVTQVMIILLPHFYSYSHLLCIGLQYFPFSRCVFIFSASSYCGHVYCRKSSKRKRRKFRQECWLPGMSFSKQPACISRGVASGGGGGGRGLRTVGGERSERLSSLVTVMLVKKVG